MGQAAGPKDHLNVSVSPDAAGAARQEGSGPDAAGAPPGKFSVVERLKRGQGAGPASDTKPGSGGEVAVSSTAEGGEFCLKVRRDRPMLIGLLLGD